MLIVTFAVGREIPRKFELIYNSRLALQVQGR